MYNIKSFCVVILARSCLCQIIIIGTDEMCVLPIANPSSKELLEERPPSIYQYLFCWFGCPSHVCVLIILNGIKEIRTFAVIWLQTPYFLFSGDVAFTPALIQPWLCPHSHLAAWLLSSLSLCRFGSWCHWTLRSLQHGSRFRFDQLTQCQSHLRHHFPPAISKRTQFRRRLFAEQAPM